MLQMLEIVILFSSLISIAAKTTLLRNNTTVLRSPYLCFREDSVCAVQRKYPFSKPNYGFYSCGYPGLSIDCSKESGGRPFINISNHTYHVIDINYMAKMIHLVDADVEGNECPQPKWNFSLPYAPTWVNYSYLGLENVTVFYNCSGSPVDAERHLLCSKDNTGSTYAFYQAEIPKGSDWYRNCAKNVVVPAFNYKNQPPDPNYNYTIKYGFFIKWSASSWCVDCERSGGHCWLSRSTYKPTGCACRNGKSYFRTCPPPSPPPKPAPSPYQSQGVPPTLSTPSKFKHPPKGLTLQLKIIIGVVAATGGLLLAALLLFYRGVNSSLTISSWINKKKSAFNLEAFMERYEGLALQRYRYSDIRKMTDSFKDTLGHGGYGRVFKGELRDGRLVAVKVLNESKSDGEDFINEVVTIGRTNHVNVVNLIGFCIEGTNRALVYEFMPNGSLERFIYTQNEATTTPPLGWEKLYQIALGIARGLEYLHRGCNNRILHFDIKPHNILLDQDFCPKISDFGLAKLYPTKDSLVPLVGARGTMGYIAPELYSGNFGGVSHKADVYSYGMMMLEMIGGRKNMDATVENISEIYFPLWVYNHLKRSNDAVDSEEIQSKEVFQDERAKKMIMVALWCIQAHPMDRPSTSKVVDMLEGNTHDLQMPPNPIVDPRSSSSTSA